MTLKIQTEQELHEIADKAFHILYNLVQAENDLHSDMDIRGIARIEKWKGYAKDFVEEVKTKYS